MLSFTACVSTAIPSVLYLPVNTGEPLSSCAVIACLCLCMNILPGHAELLFNVACLVIEKTVKHVQIVHDLMYGSDISDMLRCADMYKDGPHLLAATCTVMN